MAVCIHTAILGYKDLYWQKSHAFISNQTHFPHVLCFYLSCITENRRFGGCWDYWHKNINKACEDIFHLYLQILGTNNSASKNVGMPRND